jgi:1-acyl-sn-glycerol-3-phosphate acyltransferase
LIKDILARVYFVYAALLFAITMLPIALLFLIARSFFNEHKSSIIIQKGFQVWMGIYMPLIFCPVKHVGRNQFKKGQNYVVTLNHNSLADVPVSSPGIPGPNRTLAKIEMSKIPIFGYIYSSGSILLDREDQKSRTESFKKMVAALEKGLHLCLFPEGTRNKTHEPLARFFDGAFRVAIMAQKPVMPGLIFGTKNFFHPTKKYWIWPHRIEFHFLEPIETAGLGTDQSDALKVKVFGLMKEYYSKNSHLI